MSEQQITRVYQLDNGYWGYRFVITAGGKKKAQKRVKDEQGKPFKTAKQAAKARIIAIEQEKSKAAVPKKEIVRKTVAEIQDYPEELYYTDNRAYTYTESFLKMFYLIFGQAYSRNYFSTDYYNRLCVNKDTKIHMPKTKVDDDLDIIAFDDKEMGRLDSYFKRTNAETVYMLGKYCGLRINECYGLKWSNVDLKSGIVTIDRQMQYQEGLKLVLLKTRNAKRKIHMCSKLKEYLLRNYIWVQ